MSLHGDLCVCGGNRCAETAAPRYEYSYSDYSSESNSDRKYKGKAKPYSRTALTNITVLLN